MSTTFPVKKFIHVATNNRLEGEVVLESSLAYQVAVGGKIQVLQKNEWSLDGGFEDIFSQFGRRPDNGFGGLFGG